LLLDTFFFFYRVPLLLVWCNSVRVQGQIAEVIADVLKISHRRLSRYVSYFTQKTAVWDIQATRFEF
jgi:hypothetical protein